MITNLAHWIMMKSKVNSRRHWLKSIMRLKLKLKLKNFSMLMMMEMLVLSHKVNS